MVEWFNKVKSSGLKLNARMYNLVIDGFTKARQFEKAVEYYEEMKKAGIRPDRITYQFLIRGCGYARYFYKDNLSSSV